MNSAMREIRVKVRLTNWFEEQLAELSRLRWMKSAAAKSTLARAFINRPKILFADEPTGNLDAEMSAGIIEIMLDLNRSAGTALVLVTHDPDVAKLTERTIRLRSGEMI